MRGRPVAVTCYYERLKTRGARLLAVIMGGHCAVAVVTLRVCGSAVHCVHAVRRDTRWTVKRCQYDVRVSCGIKTQVNVKALVNELKSKNSVTHLK